MLIAAMHYYVKILEHTLESQISSPPNEKEKIDK